MSRSITDIILEKIMNDSRLKNSKAFSGVYRDEPIIKKASAMRTYVPEKISLMRKINANPYTLRFYKQAAFMENYEDDYVYSGSFTAYYPCYSDMNTEQLRGYFTWRKEVRRGNIKETNRGYVFMYIYELLMLIGARDEVDAYEKIKAFAEKYNEYDGILKVYITRWLNDFAVYYNLDRSYFTAENDPCAEFLPTMIHMDEAGDEELFNAAANLSSYNILRSRLYSQKPDVTKQAVCAVLRAYSSYYNKHRKKTFAEHLFGGGGESSIQMFEGAVFYDRRKYGDYEYVYSESLKYKCVQGCWYKVSIGVSAKSRRLGEIIRGVDFCLRERLNITPQIKEKDISKQTLGIIAKALDAVEKQEEEKRRNAPKKIELDFSKLSGIRKAADITRDRLMTEEDMGAEEEGVKVTADNPTEKSLGDKGAVQEKTSAANENNSALSSDEKELLNVLLSGGDPLKFAAGKGFMLSVICEKINEKLFDGIGDNVIEFEGEKPYITEDYEEDVKGFALE